MLAAAAAVAGVLAGAAAAAAALGPAPGALRAAHAGARRRAPGIGRCGPPPAAWPAERGGWRPLRAGEATAERRLYEVLGVEQNAEVRSIKKAYYNMARDCHPDKFPGDEAMRARFQEVAEAYQTLADPVRRQQYDLGGLAALAYLKTNATRLFGPPPWRVMIGRTDHWMWEPDQREYTISIIAGAIPNGIAGVTVQVVCDAIEEAYQTRVAVLLDRVSEEQAKDTVAEIEEFGLAVKAEPIEDEREGEQESPLQYFRRIQRELGMAAESLRSAAIEVPLDFTAQKNPDEDLDKWIETVKSVRSELRAAAKGLEEFKIKQTGPAM